MANQQLRVAEHQSVKIQMMKGQLYQHFGDAVDEIPQVVMCNQKFMSSKTEMIKAG